jgi:hypothetical protein
LAELADDAVQEATGTLLVVTALHPFVPAVHDAGMVWQSVPLVIVHAPVPELRFVVQELTGDQLPS